VRLTRRLLQSDVVQRALCALAALYIRLAHMTGRWQTAGGEIPRRFWEKKEPFILCFWHGRLLMMPYCWNPGAAIHMLISQHRDGQIIARTVSHFGIATIAGSSSRGGGAALRSLVREIRSGACVGITPDGPRGPRMRASIGVAQAARLSGAAVIPAAFSCKPRRVLGSWDQFIVAAPFARGVFVWGEPIRVARDADEAALERARGQIEAGLNGVTRRADVICGQNPVEPAAEHWAPPESDTDEDGDETGAAARASMMQGAGGR
jgi:lysophospholipid acyltransferase (LPLAT)-like uncharacterized protein